MTPDYFLDPEKCLVLLFVNVSLVIVPFGPKGNKSKLKTLSY